MIPIQSCLQRVAPLQIINQIALTVLIKEKLQLLVSNMIASITLIVHTVLTKKELLLLQIMIANTAPLIADRTLT